MMCVVLAVVLGLIALTFFAAERSLSVFSWFRLEELNVPRSRKNAAGDCLRNRGLVVTTFLVAGVLAIAALSVVLVVGVTNRWYVGLIILGLVLALGWILPEIIASRMGDRLAIYLVPALYEVVGIPFRALRLGLRRQESAPGDESEQPESALSPAGRGAINRSASGDATDTQAHKLFRMAVRLKYMQTRDIMTPRTDMVTVPETATLGEAARISMESGYSRLPVHRSNRDQIVGILHAKDLLKLAGGEKWDQPATPEGKPALAELLRQPFFVPETKTVSELMEELQRSNVHLGIVVDEYGGTRGLVTLEDVVEELIGEIRDEHEAPHEEPPLFQWLGNRSVEVAAAMRVEAFNDEFDVDLPERKDFDTIGGLATFMLSKIPATGESFQFGGTRVTVIQADSRRVIRARVDFDHDARRKSPPSHKGAKNDKAVGTTDEHG